MTTASFVQHRLRTTGSALASRRARRRGGFTLLEVMIAVVILAVGLSSLFTSEAGAIRIAQRARTTTIASLLARCKMGEIEEKVLKEGWPAELIEERDECCEDGEREGFSCEWKVERIKLPDIEESEDESGDDDDDDEKRDGKETPREPGMIDQLAELSKEDPKERLTSITDMLSGGGTSSAEGDDEAESESTLDPMSAMVMELAFPIMKPVIEEGVRRATVEVLWKEGKKEQRLSITQFLVTEEQIILPEDDEGDAGTGTGTPGTGTGTGTNTNTNTNTNTSKPGITR